MMPGIDGFETCRLLKEDEATRDSSVIFMSALDDTEHKVRGLDLGAVDYITKPFQSEEVIARVNTHLRIRSLEQALAQRNRVLESANEKMRRDLEAAAKLQQSLLPTTLNDSGAFHFAWRFHPCDELGGDLLNVVRVDDRNMVIYVADVSGHGVASSLLSVAMHRSLSLRAGQPSLIATPNTDASGYTMTPPAEVLQQLNEMFPMRSNGGHFITAMYGVLDLSSGLLNYSMAGHPGPLLIRRGESPMMFDHPSFPIGVVDDGDYQTIQFQFKPGDRLTLFSDGLIEAMNMENDLFGSDRLGVAFDHDPNTGLESMIDQAIQEISTWQAGRSFDDDLSVLAVEMTGA
ncbi:MAG: SpoIIE family protein phosphatase, partial [Planctomycetota bacterium]|nr:SpoIIE family protein phosphatase [Planctomycetota bacterium]